MHFSNILDKFGIMLTGLWFLLISFLPFLYKGVISACLRISENVDNFMELLKFYRENYKKYLCFILKILYGYHSFVIPYLHLALKSLFQFVSDQPQ